MNCLEQMDIAGKRVLMRVDFNVPLKDGTITDDNRIRASLLTIRHCLDNGAAVIICAHLGKPKGKVVPELSLAPVAKHLAGLLGKDVPLAPASVGPEVTTMAEALKPGQVMMLENLRFHPEEKGKTEADRGDFGARLAALADLYVSDAFGVAHRANASVVDAPRHAKACCAGFLMQKEWKYLGDALKSPERPFVAVSGGAKVSSKLGILENLLGKVDDFIIGGAMANTFLLAQGHEIGKSLAEQDLVKTAQEIMATAQERGSTLHLPVDVVLGKSLEDTTPFMVCGTKEVPRDALILDIGPQTVKQFTTVLEKAGTVVWNGPMGLFENPVFAEGSLSLCRTMAGLDNAVTIVGGGDTDAVVHHLHLADKFTFISTGGGSFLEFLEGKELPGFQALKECSKK